MPIRVTILLVFSGLLFCQSELRGQQTQPGPAPAAPTVPAVAAPPTDRLQQMRAVDCRAGHGVAIISSSSTSSGCDRSRGSI